MVGVIAKLGRARDDVHGRAPVSAAPLPRRNTSNENCGMRLPKLGERQSFEHDIGQAAIGRRLLCALHGCDQAVGILRFGAV